MINIMIGQNSDGTQMYSMCSKEYIIDLFKLSQNTAVYR